MLNNLFKHIPHSRAAADIKMNLTYKTKLRKYEEDFTLYLDSMKLQ